jgi:short-chain 2-methylacyl-CoA dehydrogenase
MSYALSETHQKLRERVREFAEKHIRPIAQELDDKEEFSVELTRNWGYFETFLF